MKAKKILCSILLIGLALPVKSAEPNAPKLTPTDAANRLYRALIVAEYLNQIGNANQISECSKNLQEAFRRQDLTGAELLVRSMEHRVGIDSGGKTMNSLPIAQLSRKEYLRLKDLQGPFSEAISSHDPKQIQKQKDTLEKILGSQIGIPDFQPKPEKKEHPFTWKSRDLAIRFIELLDSDEKRFHLIESGTPIKHMPPYVLASMIVSCCEMRPLIKEQQPTSLARLDRIISGGCRILLSLQAKDGYFTVFDIGDTYLSYREPIRELFIRESDLANEDVPIPKPFLHGNSIPDTVSAGIALFTAESIFQNADWKSAGIQAANWLQKQPLEMKVHINASTNLLLLKAYQSTGEKVYLQCREKVWKAGIAPWQLKTGRWMLPEDARLFNQLRILKSLRELEKAKPVLDRDASKQLKSSIVLAEKVLLDFWETNGLTNSVESLAYLLSFQTQRPDEQKKWIRLFSGNLESLAVHGDKIKLGIPLDRLSVLAPVVREKR